MRRALLVSERAYRVARRARILARYAARRPHEPDFAAFAHFARDGRLFLDVGANAGQSALSFRLFHPRAPILSIEPNDANEPELRFVRRIIRKFDFLICAAGDERGVATLFVPTLRGVPLTGEASVVGPLREDDYTVKARGDVPFEEFGVVEKQVEVRPLDDLALEPGFVKIDVEDAELAVLRGLRRTLERHRPVIMVERTSALDELVDFLAPLGYELAVYLVDERRFAPYTDQDAQNVFFLPPGARPG